MITKNWGILNISSFKWKINLEFMQIHQHGEPVQFPHNHVVQKCLNYTDWQFPLTRWIRIWFKKSFLIFFFCVLRLKYLLIETHNICLKPHISTFEMFFDYLNVQVKSLLLVLRQVEFHSSHLSSISDHLVSNLLILSK